MGAGKPANPVFFHFLVPLTNHIPAGRRLRKSPAWKSTAIALDPWTSGEAFEAAFAFVQPHEARRVCLSAFFALEVRSTHQ